MTWPPPGTVERRAPDVGMSLMVRSIVLFVAVTAAAIAVAGGFRALFLL